MKGPIPDRHNEAVVASGRHLHRCVAGEVEQRGIHYLGMGPADVVRPNTSHSWWLAAPEDRIPATQNRCYRVAAITGRAEVPRHTSRGIDQNPRTLRECVVVGSR